MPEPTGNQVHVPVPGRKPRRLLKNLRLSRIDLVDNGASQDRGSGQGAHVVLYKRDVSTEERERLADKGHAMADGGYPIANTSDLKNAIQAFGRAKNPDAVKAHIRRRASALGASDQLPESWTEKADKTMPFEPFEPKPKGDGEPKPGTGSDADEEKDEEKDKEKEPAEKAATREEPPMPAEVTTATLQKRLDDQAAENVRLQKRLDDQEKILKAEREKNEQRDYIAKCAHYPGLVLKADDDWKVLREIDQKLTPEAATRVGQLFKAASAAIEAGNLFKEMGSAAPGTGTSAWAEIEALAEGIVAKGEKGLTKPQAVDLVCKQNPELYRRHQDEQRARSMNALPR